MWLRMSRTPYWPDRNHVKFMKISKRTTLYNNMGKEHVQCADIEHHLAVRWAHVTNDDSEQGVQTTR